ncbi:hypothetical protein HK098_006690 [Nowakowskiella sp. JEL0407]|nr:hypothetical protein HK098_006690 [Nowakowskiella sp. JEL0407]
MVDPQEQLIEEFNYPQPVATIPTALSRSSSLHTFIPTIMRSQLLEKKQRHNSCNIYSISLDQPKILSPPTDVPPENINLENDNLGKNEQRLPNDYLRISYNARHSTPTLSPQRPPSQTTRAFTIPRLNPREVEPIPIPMYPQIPSGSLLRNLDNLQNTEPPRLLPLQLRESKTLESSEEAKNHSFSSPDSNFLDSAEYSPPIMEFAVDVPSDTSTTDEISTKSKKKLFKPPPRNSSLMYGDDLQLKLTPRISSEKLVLQPTTSDIQNQLNMMASDDCEKFRSAYYGTDLFGDYGCISPYLCPKGGAWSVRKNKCTCLPITPIWDGSKCVSPMSNPPEFVYIGYPMTVTSEHFEIKSKIYRKSCVDGGLNYKQVQLQMWECNGTPDQAFYYTNGQIISVQSGLCLDVPNNSPRQGAKVQLHDCNGTAAQQWVFRSIDGHVVILFKGTNFLLNDWNADNSKGAQIGLWTYSDGDYASLWDIVTECEGSSDDLVGGGCDRTFLTCYSPCTVLSCGNSTSKNGCDMRCYGVCMQIDYIKQCFDRRDRCA